MGKLIGYVNVLHVDKKKKLLENIYEQEDQLIVDVLE
jgi:hypothetical protein